jgi:hypothetical protein
MSGILLPNVSNTYKRHHLVASIVPAEPRRSL